MISIIPFLMSVILTFFATGVMSYISMATPIGPWIAPTIVLMALVIFKSIRFKKDASAHISLIAASTSLGGIIATACGFSFPTLFFCEANTFNAWMASPLYFACALGGLSLVAGAFGIWVANTVEHKLLIEEKLDFPIGQLVHKMIAASQQLRKAYELVAGFLGTLIFSLLQEGYKNFAKILPTSITFFGSTNVGIFSLPLIRFDLWPLLWAVGFVAGPIIAVPLLVGSLSRIFVLDPINTLFFAQIQNMEFVLAFCSGMVVAGAVGFLFVSPTQWHKLFKSFVHKWRSKSSALPSLLSKTVVREGVIVCALAIAFLTFFKLPLLTQIYLLITTWICSYQMAVIAGKIGLAQLGRWATFVMVPALFLFNLSCLQIVLIATFVEISGGVTCDVLFGRKLGQLQGVSSKKIRWAQYLGLVLTAMCVGIIFWLLISHFHLGSEKLFAQRAQSRSLLLEAQTFNLLVLCIGFLFGVLLKWVKLNPMLVLGGLLMPLHLTMGLLFGGLINYLTPNKEAYIPFWSGVFAGGSVWMLLRTLV